MALTRKRMAGDELIAWPRYREYAACLAAGFASGALALGIGGRLLMRLLAFTTPELPRFSWFGSFEVVAAGAVWGIATSPILVFLERRLRRRSGPVFGLIVLAIAVPPFLVLSGFRGSLEAPALFLWLSAVSFPILFVAHGWLVSHLWRRWRPGSSEAESDLDR